MTRLGNLCKRFIYTIEFEDRSIYIGLTNDLGRREFEHNVNSCNRNVKELISNNIKYKFNSDNILYDVDTAIMVECSMINDYKDKGYNVLNISKGGGLGGNNMKWTEELLRTESQKYNKKSDFKKYSRGAFEAALKKKILDDICPHMKSFIKWTEELLRKEALKYKTRIDFYENSSGYIAAKRRGILDEICTHMRKSKFTI